MKGKGSRKEERRQRKERTSGETISSEGNYNVCSIQVQDQGRDARAGEGSPASRAGEHAADHTPCFQPSQGIAYHMHLHSSSVDFCSALEFKVKGSSIKRIIIVIILHFLIKKVTGD